MLFKLLQSFQKSKRKLLTNVLMAKAEFTALIVCISFSVNSIMMRSRSIVDSSTRVKQSNYNKKYS